MSALAYASGDGTSWFPVTTRRKPQGADTWSSMVICPPCFNGLGMGFAHGPGSTPGASDGGGGGGNANLTGVVSIRGTAPAGATGNPKLSLLNGPDGDPNQVYLNLGPGAAGKDGAAVGFIETNRPIWNRDTTVGLVLNNQAPGGGTCGQIVLKTDSVQLTNGEGDDDADFTLYTPNLFGIVQLGVETPCLVQGSTTFAASYDAATTVANYDMAVITKAGCASFQGFLNRGAGHVTALGNFAVADSVVGGTLWIDGASTGAGTVTLIFPDPCISTGGEKNWPLTTGATASYGGAVFKIRVISDAQGGNLNLVLQFPFSTAGTIAGNEVYPTPGQATPAPAIIEGYTTNVASGTRTVTCNNVIEGHTYNFEYAIPGYVNFQAYSLGDPPVSSIA